MLGLDYSAFNTNGELDLYDPSTGKGRLTNMYLADRAEYLANLLYANSNDTTDSGTDVQYVDLSDRVTLNQPLLLNPEKKISFGTDTADLLEGSWSVLAGDNVVDHLYGMGGNDAMQHCVNIDA
ncbi:hypothetical protein [Geothermobacter hydrogeniphilus]|uniref:Uncharacterized protein n=1 Tax=Geothermobacter hydrogeniphilus TaxID=1969733 RepID=A0A1X0YAB2_9BACT|nr:hypothetical protein [Geothermobacter hydrogeniphilus]ORJ62019.1 hypothetical protein B5V00_04500 [Geothermobacter hydrogeniphilus]